MLSFRIGGRARPPPEWSGVNIPAWIRQHRVTDLEREEEHVKPKRSLGL
jgi:hypothetical protein